MLITPCLDTKITFNKRSLLFLVLAKHTEFPDVLKYKLKLAMPNPVPKYLNKLFFILKHKKLVKKVKLKLINKCNV